jgi:pyrroloquinoline quinone biosynthesis protein B
VKVRLLGTAAGGGFPQWNCACSNCDALRRGTIASQARHEFCAAISADGKSWFLLEAPSDVRAHVEQFVPLQPGGAVRGTRIEGVLLTGADLDQSLGLLTLREGPGLAVHATATVKNSLAAGLRLPAVLDCYSGATWHEPPRKASALLRCDGTPSGLKYAAFAAVGQSPRYLRGRRTELCTDRVGYLIIDETTGGRLIALPGFASLDDGTLDLIGNCHLLLIDGTFWSDDELRRTGAGMLSAAEMGHLPVGGPAGSLAAVGPVPARRKIYVHMNNTNPMLADDSAESLAVRQAGMEVGRDGIDFEL